MSRVQGSKDARALQRWARDWQSVNARERAEQARRPLPTARSVEVAFELIDLFDRFHRWPAAPDPVRLRGERRARSQWVRLHRRLAGR